MVHVFVYHVDNNVLARQQEDYIVPPLGYELYSAEHLSWPHVPVIPLLAPGALTPFHTTGVLTSIPGDLSPLEAGSHHGMNDYPDIKFALLDRGKKQNNAL